MFDLIDGKWYNINNDSINLNNIRTYNLNEKIVSSDDDSSESSSESSSDDNIQTEYNGKSRNMSDYFKDGDQIRHKSNNHILNAKYNASSNTIIYRNKKYNSLSAFALDHHNKYNPCRTSANGWDECECKINNRWIKIKKI